jgi:hypothetical protein
MGWDVVRVWEHDLSKPGKVAVKLKKRFEKELQTVKVKRDGWVLR